MRPLPGDSAAGPGRGARSEVRKEESRRGGEPHSVPGGHVRAEERARIGVGRAGRVGGGESGFREPGRGRAPTHLPAGATARARGQRGAAPGVHVVSDAQHPQEGEAEQHPRAPPHSPHSAAGRGAAARECCLGPAGGQAGGQAGGRGARGGAEEGEGRGAAPPPARAPSPGGGEGWRRALGAELRPGPGGLRGARAGSGGFGGGREVREQRATNPRAAAAPARRRRGLARLQSCSAPATPPPLRPPARPSAPLE